MARSQERHLKRLAHRQASDLLGEDINHERRVRSAEGVRFAFSNLPVPGFKGLVDIENVTDDATVIRDAHLPADALSDT